MSKEYSKALEILKIALHHEWLRLHSQFKELDEKTKLADGVRMVSSDAEAFLTIKYALRKAQKEHKALEIIKRFIWVEDDKLMCGRYGDVEIELDESDFEDDEEELDLLKEVLQ